MRQLICVMALAFTAMVLSSCSVDGNQRADKVGETVVGQSIARSKDAVCMDNLKQVRAAIEMQKTVEDVPPQDLTVLKLPSSMLACPIGNEPYTYDPTTGSVKCPHPGHGKY